ncbi:MAG TPA: hypothetical protein VL307_03520 [Chitinophagaceae bacterium]|nr:hypothetical protein [Chitinophagaceae bacterium]
MEANKNREIIEATRRRLIRTRFLVDAMLSVGIGFLASVLNQQITGGNRLWGLLVAFIAFLILTALHKPWRVSREGIARLLDQQYPSLQESSALLLQSPAELQLLEQLQYHKVTTALSAIQSPLQLNRRLRGPACWLVIMLLAAVVLGLLLPHKVEVNAGSPAKLPPALVKQEAVLPGISGVSISIRPPAYTRHPAREQHNFSLLAETGAVASWELSTGAGVGKVEFIFNDRRHVALQSNGKEHTQWKLEKVIDSTGFYQVSIDGRLSELYTLQTIPDAPPVIGIHLPKQYTIIDYGQPEQVHLRASITDDYGIKEAFIAATIASGSGEAVKFKEQRIPLNGFAPGAQHFEAQQLLALQKMGMKPGDELYFYLQATDYHQQQTRSDIQIVQLPDPAQLMSMDGLANSLTLKPEYFRSQRQIIIETEQLLKDRDTISSSAFESKSNNLGIDQQLLRLRYGKFLGDELSGETEGADGLGDIADFSNADKVRDAFTDHHDNAEDATYLDPQTKKQLRVIINQMWNAELHLRTFTPKEALPFAYKALRLLKDLQQQSRVYVAKTNFKTTPLDPAKRLSGDLSKIKAAHTQKTIVPDTDPQQYVREAIAWLNSMAVKHTPIPDNGRLLQAQMQLQQKAIAQPALYLPAVQAMKRVVSNLQLDQPVAAADILLLQKGLQSMLQMPATLPSAARSGTRVGLSKQYFDHLQQTQP